MNSKHLFCAALLISVLSNSISATPKSLSTVVEAENIEWGYLNPLRGEKSPGAANLWGDRTKNQGTGMLVKFNKGFSSPPHIHNISYRGIVIEGLMHNADPNAVKRWMPTGSFWTQPAGENHITAAQGSHNLIYLEIDSGPYLVKPTNKQFDNGESALNLHASNIVWLSNNNLKNIESSKVKIAHLWGSANEGEISGSLVKLAVGFKGELLANAQEFRAVVIKGSVLYHSIEHQNNTSLTRGSYVSSTGAFKHSLQTSDETVLYIRTNGRYQVSSN